jgi:MFS transporter, UMF1 family
MRSPIENRRTVYSWALYDWANSAFATTVMAGFFPIFFKTYASAGAPATTSTAQLGLANALGSLLIAFLAPILGAIADAGSYKKRFLMTFTLISALTTAALCTVNEGNWALAVVLYAVAGSCFGAALSL